MSKRNFHLHDGKKGSALAVRVVPLASRNEIVEIMHDGTVKIRLTNAADDQNLNHALLGFLSGTLQVPAEGIDIVAGMNGLDKLVSILNLDASKVQQRIIRKIKIK